MQHQLLFCNPAGFARVRSTKGHDRAYLGWEGVQAFQATLPRGLLAASSDPYHHELINLPPREFFDAATFDFIVRWPDFAGMRAVDPWPRFELEWGSREFSSRTLFRPEVRYGLLSFTPTPERREQFGRVVEAVFDAAARFAPKRAQASIERGWLDVEDMPWAPTDTMPSRAEQAPGLGAFRTAERGARVVAERTSPTAMEALLQWLASSPDRPWQDTPREVALTHDTLHACFHDGSVRYVARSALRTRLGDPEEDAVYIFGRRTFVLLTARPDCAVRAALDRQLAEQGA